MNRFSNVFLIIVGTMSIVLGVVGIIIPMLPTTPFVLLGAACYVRSSPRLYSWLINNRWLGTYIKNYHEGNGLSLKAKVSTLTLLWISIGYSIIFITNSFPIRTMLFLIALRVTYHILEYTGKGGQSKTD